MDLRSFFRAALSRGLFGLVVICLLTNPAHSVDSQDSQIFISGFNAYQKKDYSTAIDKMTQVLQQYPDTPLRDMALFWLARSNFKAGNRQEAGKQMARFFKEYPDSPLKGTVEDELVTLAKNHEKGEALSTASVKPATDQDAAERARAAAAEQERQKVAADKAEADRLAAAKAAQEKQALEQEAAARAEAEKAAQARAEQERIAKEKAAADRQAAEQAEQERVAREKSAEEARLASERDAAAKAEAERQMAAKAEEERRIREQGAAEEGSVAKAAAAKKAQPVETVAVNSGKPANTKVAASARKSSSAQKKEKQRKDKRTNTLRNKAIAEYKTVVDRFPGTSAAAGAQSKLREMGVVYPAQAGAVEGNVQVLNLEIAQFAAVDFKVTNPDGASEVNKRVSIPFEITNRGNGDDSFYLEAGFPPEYNAQVAAAENPGAPINMTSPLPPGGTFKGILSAIIPRNSIDGRKSSYPLKAASQFAREVSQSRQISLVSAAPFLRAVIKSDKAQLLPGERVSYKIALLNIGNAPARGVSLRLNYPPQYEPIAPLSAGFRQEMQAALVIDGVQLKSGESKEYSLSFKLKDEAVAKQELVLRGDLVNTELETKDSFLSTAAYVQVVSGVAVRVPVERLVVIPGQTIAMPLIVTNTGNVREPVALRPTIPSPIAATFYHDLNRDGIRQAGEPAVTSVGPLAPKEEAYLLLEIATPGTAADGSEANLDVLMEPENGPNKGVTARISLLFARPMVDLAMASQGGRLRPGEVASFDLTCTNRGSSMARVVEVQSVLPVNLDMVVTDPPFQKGGNGAYLWRFAELGAGEKKNVKVTFRIKEGITVGTTIQVRNQINYEDQLGNRY